MVTWNTDAFIHGTMPPKSGQERPPLSAATIAAPVSAKFLVESTQGIIGANREMHRVSGRQGQDVVHTKDPHQVVEAGTHACVSS